MIATEPLVLESENASVAVAPAAGGRLSSLRVRGLEVLVSEPIDDPLTWGCYPMVPWAGRLDRGSFELDGACHQMPIDLAPHAIHGVGYTSVWEVTQPPVERSDGATACCVALDLSGRWPLGGRVEQAIALHTDRLELRLEVTAGMSRMPVMLGWHPWFRRTLRSGAAPVDLRLVGGRRWELDDDAIPTGRLLDVGTGPWDDCISGLSEDPVLRWPDQLDLTLRSSEDHWQVYNKPLAAVCVEPQSGAPNEFNRNARVLQETQTLKITFVIQW